MRLFVVGGVVAFLVMVCGLPCRISAQGTDGRAGAALAKSLVVAATTERLETPEFHISCKLSVDGGSPMDCHFYQKQNKRKTIYKRSGAGEYEILDRTSLDGTYAWVIHGDGDLARMSYETGRRRTHTNECFDFRTVGLSPAPSGEDIFGVDWVILQTTQFKNAGIEYVGNEAAHRIQLVADWGTREYWISQHDFRVHKIQIEAKFENWEVKSFYGTDRPAKFRWLPSRVVSHFKEHVDYQYSDIVLESETVPDAEFDIHTLELAIGTAVQDYDGSQRIGYWDGERIVEDFPYAELNAAKNAHPPKSFGWIVFVSFPVLVLVLGGVWYFTKYRSR